MDDFRVYPPEAPRLDELVMVQNNWKLGCPQFRFFAR